MFKYSKAISNRGTLDFRDHEQTFYTKHVLVVSYWHLSPYTGRVSD